MQVTPSRTVHRMDNDARTGNSSLAVRRMHDDSQQPLTTDCRTTRRSALAAGTLLLLLCVPALGVAAQATQPRVLTAQPPPERAVAGNYHGEPGIPPEMLTSGFLPSPPHIRRRPAPSSSSHPPQSNL